MYSGSSIHGVYDEVEWCLPHLLHGLFLTLKGSSCKIGSSYGPLLKLQNQGACWAETGGPRSFVFWCPLLWGDKETWKSIQDMNPRLHSAGLVWHTFLIRHYEMSSAAFMNNLPDFSFLVFILKSIALLHSFLLFEDID